MKPFSNAAIIAVVLLLTWGFTEKKGDQLSQKQKEQAMKEVTSVFDSIMAGLERMDIEGSLKYYSPNFVAYGADGRKYTFQQVRDQYSNLFKSTVSYKWTTYNLDFIVITKDFVVIKVDGKNESIFKSGGKLIYDPSHYSFALEKIEGQWKLCYHHFSGTLVK